MYMNGFCRNGCTSTGESRESRMTPDERIDFRGASVFRSGAEAAASPNLLPQHHTIALLHA